MSKKVTIEDIEAIDKDILVPADIAPILGCTPYSINVAVRNGRTFPFPVIYMNRNVRIPKMPFIKFMRGQ